MPRVLVAEQDPDVKAVYHRYLVDDGHQVLMTSNGVECIQQLRSFAPDVLLLDQDLPWGGADGVLARLLEEFTIDQVPAVIITDTGLGRQPAVKGTCFVIDYFRKPFSFDALLARIRDVGCRHGL